MMPRKRTLFNRNADSRLTAAAGRSLPTRSGSRQTSRPNDPVSATAIAARNHGPIADSVKEWTLSITPERVRNVPSRVRMKVAITSAEVQMRREPRRSATIEEWMKAVAVSHGSNAAFSTGSQPQ